MFLNISYRRKGWYKKIFHILLYMYFLVRYRKTVLNLKHSVMGSVFLSSAV